MVCMLVSAVMKTKFARFTYLSNFCLTRFFPFFKTAKGIIHSFRHNYGSARFDIIFAYCLNKRDKSTISRVLGAKNLLLVCAFIIVYFFLMKYIYFKV